MARNRKAEMVLPPESIEEPVNFSGIVKGIKGFRGKLEQAKKAAQKRKKKRLEAKLKNLEKEEKRLEFLKKVKQKELEIKKLKSEIGASKAQKLGGILFKAIKAEVKKKK